MRILIEQLYGHQWVAALNKRRLYGLDVDPPHEEVRWGSIYWAKVDRIDKTLDAAFLDLDGDNKGLLFARDYKADPGDSGKAKKDTPLSQNINPGDFLLVQAKAGYIQRLAEGDTDSQQDEGKLPRMSMNISLPGRYLIFMPMENENRISRRIRDKDLRARMMNLLEDLKECSGCILRAAAANIQTDILVREAKILREMWDQLNDFTGGDYSELIMLGPDAIQRTLSDQAGRHIESIEVVTMEDFQTVEDWCDIFAPDLMTRIEPVEIRDPERDLSLFEHYDLIKQIEDLFRPYTILPGGGSVIIEETAALIAVDVNRGADKGSNLDINIRAAEEIAHQLRLRNIGGTVIIDFLRMKSNKDRQALTESLKTAFDHDPCTVQIHGFTNLGLVEIARARRTPPLKDRLEGLIELA